MVLDRFALSLDYDEVEFYCLLNILQKLLSDTEIEFHAPRAFRVLCELASSNFIHLQSFKNKRYRASLTESGRTFMSRVYLPAREAFILRRVRHENFSSLAYHADQIFKQYLFSLIMEIATSGDSAGDLDRPHPLSLEQVLDDLIGPNRSFAARCFSVLESVQLVSLVHDDMVIHA